MPEGKTGIPPFDNQLEEVMSAQMTRFNTGF
jgi:hypothetical protein